MGSILWHHNEYLLSAVLSKVVLHLDSPRACSSPLVFVVGLVSKPRPTGLRSPPHSIVKKLAISRVRKTQQQKKEEPQMAPVAGPAAVLVEPQKRTEPEARPTLSALAVTEQKREAGAIGKSSTSLPPCTGMAGGVDGCCGNWLPGYCI